MKETRQRQILNNSAIDSQAQNMLQFPLFQTLYDEKSERKKLVD